MNKLQYHTLLVGGFALSLVTYPGQDVDGFVARQFTDASGAVMPYRVYVPGTPPARREYPLVVYLHGSGGAGTDNLRQISGGNVSGTHAWTTLEVQRREAVFVAAPQIPEGERWDDDSPVRAGRNATLVLELIDKLQKDYPIDRHRIYITGQSLGGFGAWGIAAKRPDVFAALIPLCGGGKPASAARLRGVPVWAFHGALDETVPVENSRGMVAALRKAGGTVKYTEYPDLGHAIWQRAYGDSALMAWTLAQHRRN